MHDLKPRFISPDELIRSETSEPTLVLEHVSIRKPFSGLLGGGGAGATSSQREPLFKGLNRGGCAFLPREAKRAEEEEVVKVTSWSRPLPWESALCISHGGRMSGPGCCGEIGARFKGGGGRALVELDLGGTIPGCRRGPLG